MTSHEIKDGVWSHVLHVDPWNPPSLIIFQNNRGVFFLILAPDRGTNPVGPYHNLNLIQPNIRIRNKKNPYQINYKIYNNKNMRGELSARKAKTWIAPRMVIIRPWLNSFLCLMGKPNQER